MNTLKKILPGIALSFIVTIIAKIIAIFFPTLGAATFAILLGILLGNLFFKQDIWNAGTKIAESLFLEISIFLLGTTLSIQTLVNLGFKSIIFVVLQMLLTIGIVVFVGKRMHFDSNISLLMASGNAVCGSSAIAATAPVIDADEDSKGITITMVNLMGTILMLVSPLITYFLYQNETLPSAAMIGGILQSVGQVIGSASMVSEAVVEQATIFKIMRIILLVVVVYLLKYIKTKSEPSTQTESSQSDAKPKAKIPWYIIAFFIACIINSFGIIPEGIQGSIKGFSGWLEITALSAIGLRLNFSSLLQQGKQLLIYAAIIMMSQLIIANGLIFIIF